MFNRISSSWELVRASASVLRSEKQLILFPILSAIASLLVTVSFLIPLAVYAYVHHLFTASPELGRHITKFDADLHNPIGYVLMFLFYVTQYTVVFFANTALIGAALIRLRGGNPTVADGLRLATDRLTAILGYALIASTVGMVIRSIAERTGILGRAGMGIFGFVWNIATYLVAPVLVAENVGPVDAIKRSTKLLKQTWGEQIIGNAGMNLAFGWIAFLLILVFIPMLIGAASMESIALILTVSILFVLAFTALMLIQAALSGIYTAAVYLYASEGVLGGPFDAEMIRGAFRPKK